MTEANSGMLSHLDLNTSKQDDIRTQRTGTNGSESELGEEPII